MNDALIKIHSKNMHIAAVYRNQMMAGMHMQPIIKLEF